jgi:glycerol kinase
MKPQLATATSSIKTRGSISIAGAAVTWLKGIGLIKSATEVETCAAKVKDSGDVYFVPA